MRSRALATALTLILLAACNNPTPEPPRAPSVPRAPFDTTSFTGAKLAAQLIPRHRSGSVLLEPITNTELLEQLRNVPPGRLVTGAKQYEQDLKYQAEVGKLVEEGIIGPSTLVLDDTTHAIANLAGILREPSLGVVGTVHLPWSPYQTEKTRPGQPPARASMLIAASQETIADQAQTFGDLIEEQQKASARMMATTVYVALNAARHVELRTEGWPRPEAYLVFGLTRVVVLIERAMAYGRRDSDVAPDLMLYLTELRQGGLPVQVVAVDSRLSP